PFQTHLKERTQRITVTLLLVSCSFLLLNAPYCILWLLNYINKFQNQNLKSIKELTELFMLTNFCINFLLYCIGGKLFRSQLKCLLKCRFNDMYFHYTITKTKQQQQSMTKTNKKPTQKIQILSTLSTTRQSNKTKKRSSSNDTTTSQNRNNFYFNSRIYYNKSI
ncbi:unnamed protein product, partial [Didymodactylos carnosus]